MSTALLELAADCLGTLADDVVFLGGASIGLWISDTAAPPVRATNDVDVVLGATYAELDAFAARLRSRGFTDDRGVICRYRHPAGLVLDVMPTDATVLGFGNRWYDEAVTEAAHVVLPSGRVIRAVSPPWLVATKLDAYSGRGGGDPVASADFEDLVRIVDGRQELRAEIAAAPGALRRFIADEFGRLAQGPDFDESVASALPPDAGQPGSRGDRDRSMARHRRRLSGLIAHRPVPELALNGTSGPHPAWRTSRPAKHAAGISSSRIVGESRGSCIGAQRFSAPGYPRRVEDALTIERVALTPASPLRLSTGGREGTARRVGDTVERLLHIGREPVLLRARPAAAGALALSARARDAAAARAGLVRLRFWTGVDDDLRPFLRRFRDDPLIGGSVRAAPHLRPWRRPTPFEALMWAVCEQLVTDERAREIARAIVAAHGRRDPQSGLRDAPDAEAIAGLSPALLQRCGLSAGRSRALIASAREVASGRVDLDAPPGSRAAGARRLASIPGIGPWTLAVLALHGQGDHDAIPAGDHAYLTLAGEVMTGRDHAKATERDVMELVAPYAGWRGLAGLHLLRVGSRRIAARRRAT